MADYPDVDSSIPPPPKGPGGVATGHQVEYSSTVELAELTVTEIRAAALAAATSAGAHRGDLSFEDLITVAARFAEWIETGE
jgi:hypothetical protein